jgi:16S rRNA (uracil1498-N3)-methyltransferase
MSETPRTFVKRDNINPETGIILIDNRDELHHLLKVLRIKAQDTILISDGEGIMYKTKVISTSSELIETRIEEKDRINRFPKISIRLYQSILKGEKHEFVLQKATELGIEKLCCFFSDRSNVKINKSDDLDNKAKRWKKIIFNASKQSKRTTIPDFSLCSHLQEALSAANTTDSNTLTLFCCETYKENNLKNILKNITKKPETINIFIGPEGGWSPEEIALISKLKLTSVSIGNNILRAETAAILMIGYIIYEYEFH